MKLGALLLTSASDDTGKWNKVPQQKKKTAADNMFYNNKQRK